MDRKQYQGIHAERRSDQNVLPKANRERRRGGKQIGPVNSPITGCYQSYIGCDRAEFRNTQWCCGIDYE